MHFFQTLAGYGASRSVVGHHEGEDREAEDEEQEQEHEGGVDAEEAGAPRHGPHQA